MVWAHHVFQNPALYVLFHLAGQWCQLLNLHALIVGIVPVHSPRLACLFWNIFTAKSWAHDKLSFPGIIYFKFRIVSPVGYHMRQSCLNGIPGPRDLLMAAPLTWHTRTLWFADGGPTHMTYRDPVICWWRPHSHYIPGPRDLLMAAPLTWHTRTPWFATGGPVMQFIK